MTSRSDPLRFEYGPDGDGVRLVYQRSPPGAASVAATYVGPAGWGFDGSGRGGLARIVNHLVTSAAGPYDRVELARRLDAAGATLARQCAPESAEVTIWGPADELRTLLGLLAEVVLRPRFDPDDLARVRRQVFERQLRELAQPASRSERVLLESVFPDDHPYRTTGLGDHRSVERLRRETLVRFHRERYSAGGALLVVTAPHARPAIERAVRERFREFDRPAGPPLQIPTVRAGRRTERRIRLPGNSQVEVRIGGASIARTAPEFPAAFLANEVLGGRPLLARLFQRVRERGGLAYHASSELETMRFGGYWLAQAGTGADRWRKVVPMLREEVERIRSKEVAPRELARIRESAIGSLPLSLESTSDAHELAVDAAYYGLPEDHWVTWPDRLRAVRPADLRSAAELAYDRSTEVTVLAGPVTGR